MNQLPPFSTPSRVRSEAPASAPERRTPEPDAAGFARSLASVRGLERRATSPARNTSERVDDRAARGATSAGRSQAQVQALMLSGAMKFAAARNADGAPATVTVPDDTMATDVETAAPQTADAPIDVPQVVSRAELRAMMMATSPKAMITLPTVPGTAPTTDGIAPIAGDDLAVLATDVAAGEAVQENVSASTPAAVAAMQLVATLPIAVAFPDERIATPAAAPSLMRQTPGIAPIGADPRQLLDAATTLVEDHFDAPALPATASAPASTVGTASSAAVTVSVTDATPTNATSSTTPTTARGDVQRVERGMAQLSPEFRERLQRVMERMKQEFGHEVTVVETVRSSARQAALFAQGRTAPGPVVTWTRNSKHSKGLAADLMVDGKWDSPAGYARLAQVAQQEGLRTLGARDPGHVELPTEGGVSAETLGTLLSDLAGDAGDGARKLRADVDTTGREPNAQAMARVADVAQVARVAQVAEVARVATVARPGGSASRGEQPAGNDVASPLAAPGPLPQYVTDGTSATRLATPVSQVNMADRISHLMDLQASQSAKPLNSVLLRMDNANGIEDQIRIDTRGTSVDAQLGLGTAQQAAELSGRVSELREALERRGLTADGLRVQAAPRATDSVNFSRMTAPAFDVAAIRAAAEAQAQGSTRDQTARDQQHREALAREQDRPTPRSSSDDARHRSRREQPETRQ